MKKESKYILSKLFVNLLIVIIGAIFMVGLLTAVQYQASLKQQAQDNASVLERVVDTIESNSSDAKILTDLFHRNNISTLNDIKYLLTSGLYDDLADQNLEERSKTIKNILDKTNSQYLYIIDGNGLMVLSPVPEYTALNLVDNNLMSKDNLKALISGNNVVEEKNETGDYYFYSVPIGSPDEDYYLVLGCSHEVLELEFSSLKDISLILKSAAVTNNGFMFAIDKNDDSFIFFEDGAKVLTGKNIYEMGSSDKILESDYRGVEKIDGTEYYCVTKDCNDYIIVAAVTNVANIYSTNGYALFWSVLGFVLVSSICLLYALIVQNDLIIHGKEMDRFYFGGKRIYFNKTIGKKVLPLMIAGVIAIFGISYYVQTLMELSTYVNNSEASIVEMENRMIEVTDMRKDITDYYENQYLSKAKLLSFLMEEDPSVLNADRNKYHTYYDSDNIKHNYLDDEGNPLMAVSSSNILQQYCDENQISSIYVMNEDGHTIATNSDDWYFTLSFDKDDQSYPFRELLDGKMEYLIQDKMTDEMGRTSQYIATPLTYYTAKDAGGNTVYVSCFEYENYLSGQSAYDKVTKHSSILQINIGTETMDKILASTEYSYVISQKANSDIMMALFDNNDEHRCLYSFVEGNIGKTADDMGISNKAFLGNYNGYITSGGIRYFTCFRYFNGYYMATAIPTDNMYVYRGNVATATALCSLLFITIMSALITISSDDEEDIFVKISKKTGIDSINQTMFDILMPSGKTSVTKRAVARFDNKQIPWNEKTPEQKLETILAYATSIVIILIIFTLYYSRRNLDNSSVLSYIISGQWDHSFNVFAITACAIVWIVTTLGVKALGIVVNIITSIFGTKSETVGHLILSVLKYGGAIAIVFYCLYLLGFDSSSLLASAGILSLVIGLGAQSLIKDIIAGIFIVFEGEFRVGDIVSIGGYRGQVLDIGLRTTKVMADDQNIKIIKNNDVSGVINMTRALSLFQMEFTVEFGVPLSKIEDVMKAELPLISENIPEIVAGPTYKGISRFDQRSISFTIEASCKEIDMLKAKYDLNREIIDMLYRNGINIK